MRVVLVSGIWPPDIGGPATHGPELARFLIGVGHDVRAVTMADGEPEERACPIRAIPRRLPFPLRYGAVAGATAAEARAADIVYSSGTYGAAAAGAGAARRPLAVKLVSDPAFERARRYGLVSGDVDAFQRRGGDRRVRALKALRTRVVLRAAAVVTPSAYLARIVEAWGIPAARITVIPNPAPRAQVEGTREELRERLGFPPRTLVFAGRLTRQKALDVAIDAVGEIEGATLVVVGDGPDRAELERRAASAGLDSRVRFLGRLPRERVLEALRAADAALLSSAWENFPHAAVEALAVGTPVVATAVGGVPEIVDDGTNGLLVPAGSPSALAAAARRVLDDEALRARLAAAARASVEPFAPERVYARYEALLVEAAR